VESFGRKTTEGYAMPMTAKMTEEQMVGLVRNALVVAGMEMGAEGDHWPVIKDTIHHIMQDWEDLKTEREVCAEVKKHYEKMILDLEALSSKTTEPEVKADITATVARIRDITNACFAKVDDSNMYPGEEDIPIHAKRAKEIIKTLGDSDA
jgi:hypothetical protein